MTRKRSSPPTAWQVAQRAGVSQSAVSRSPTPGAGISDATHSKRVEHRTALAESSVVGGDPIVRASAHLYFGDTALPGDREIVR